MIRNIVFDWSGTLSDDMHPCYLATMEVFRTYNISEISYEEFRNEIEYPYMKFYRKFCDKISKEQADRVFFEAIHRSPDPMLFPGAREVIESLHKTGVRMIVVSGVPEKKIQIEAKQYQVETYFHKIYGSVYDKIDIVREALSRHDFSPEQTLYVGDMDHDIHAGKASGLKTAASSWGYHTRSRLEGENPDFMLEHLFDLLGIV